MNHPNRAGRLLTLLCAALTCALAFASFVQAADDDKDWKVLGDAKIERKSGTAKIDVGAEHGLARRIKFEVRDTVRRGGRSRAINLKGGNRAIKRVVIAFKVDKDADRDALIVLLGAK
jgi:hypothetical protein